MATEIDFYFDPVCPWCWQTSQWVRQASRVRDIDVTWRFISLRFVNEPLGYDDKPEGYREVHRQGTRMLRVAAATRESHGNDAVGRLYAAMGAAHWEIDPPGDGSAEAVRAMHAAGVPLQDILDAAGLPRELAAAADDEKYDAIIREETHLGLERAGKNVGTPIISLSPPDGPAFFGPVISDLPATDEEAGETWDAMVKLAGWRGFAELKRNIRDVPDLPVMVHRRTSASN